MTTRRTLKIVPSSPVSRSYNLIAEGEDAPLVAHESYAVCDQVREAMQGRRAGVTGECLEVAEGLLRQERSRPRTTSINAVETSWTPPIWAFWDRFAAGYDWTTDWVSEANYFTPRPYVDRYNQGSSHLGFCYVLQPGHRVCFTQWGQASDLVPDALREDWKARRG